LARGVSATDDDDLLVPAEVRLDLRGAVVDAGAPEAIQVPELGRVVLSAGRDDDAPRPDLVTVLEADPLRLVPAVEPSHRAPPLAPAPPSAPNSFPPAGAPAREHLSRNARRKPQIVLDPRARPRLPAGGARLEDQHVEPLRGRIHGGSEAGRAGADHHEVARS